MPTSVAIVLASVLLLTMARSTSALPVDVQSALRVQKEIYVATRRADGSRSTAAPIWFWYDGRVLYVSTSPTSHKAKRIRKGSPVFFSVQGKDGPFYEGTAEVVTDLELVRRLGDEYAHKYWIAWLGLFRPRPSRVADGKTMVVRVTPME
jgi:general stress protein 26